MLFGERGNGSLEEIARSLIEAGGSLKDLCRMDPQELLMEKRLSEARAAKVAAALELGRRVMKPGDQKLVLTTPEEIFKYLAPTLCPLKREVFHVLCLNSRNALITDVRVAEGGVALCPVDPREVFNVAIRVRAAGIVVAHNHPSGDPTPSVADLNLTRQLNQAAELLCIRLLDHIVLGDWTFQSMAARGEEALRIKQKGASCRPTGGSS